MLRMIDRLAGWWLDWRMDRIIKNHPAAQELGLKRAEVDETGYEIIVTSPDIIYLADQAADLLESQGAENYVQFDMMPRADRGLRPIRVTVQWAHGQSPAQKVVSLKGRVEELAEALKLFARAADDWDELPGTKSARDVVPLTMEPYREARRVLRECSKKEEA